MICCCYLERVEKEARNFREFLKGLGEAMGSGLGWPRPNRTKTYLERD